LKQVKQLKGSSKSIHSDEAESLWEWFIGYDVGGHGGRQFKHDHTTIAWPM
jgi:hypothetical protein